MEGQADNGENTGCTFMVVVSLLRTNVAERGGHGRGGCVGREALRRGCLGRVDEGEGGHAGVQG